MASWTFALCLLFCASVYSDKKYPVSFEDALLQRFAPETFNGTWISRNEYIYDVDNTVVKFNLETGETSVLLNHTVYSKYSFTDVLVSEDGKWIAVEYDKQSVFRHSTTCLYTLIELSSGKEYPLTEKRRVQLLVWAPVGSGLAFVVDNNVFYQSETDRLQNKYKQVTNTSREVYNGVADWVYEEEVLEDTKALWFSPNGTKMVFATMNDEKVKNYTMWKYGNPADIAFQYPQAVVLKYPKAGSKNPVAYLNYVDLQSVDLTPVQIKAPEELVTNDNILGPVSWADDSEFSVTWLARLQTRGYTNLCSVTDRTAHCQVVYSYKEDKGWLDIEKPVWVNASAFLTVLPQDQGGEFGNYRHLSLVSDNHSVPLTSGLDVVSGISCYNRQSNTVYYSSTVNGDSARKHVYKMDISHPEQKECFTCHVDKDCVYGIATFSRECEHAILSCKGPGVPQFNIYNQKGEMVQALNDNAELREVMTHVQLPTKMDLKVPVAGGFTARVRLLLPPNFDKSGRTKYPLLFYVYSGPDTNKVLDSWPVPGWDEYLVTRRGIVLAYIDARGSGLRGDNIKFALYHRLGGPEIDDIISTAQYLQDKYPFVDRLRTAVWGWSYGGFAAAMTLGKDNLNTFRCGISVAPVTNWMYYDTIYTERYMGLPTNESNWVGYEAGNVMSRVNNFRHKLFYLIHGSADDNVHFQQSMMLTRALELADITFFQQNYPDETHSLSHVRRHLYHSMDQFWTRCFHLNSSDYLDPGLPFATSTEEFSSMFDPEE